MLVQKARPVSSSPASPIAKLCWRLVSAAVPSLPGWLSCSVHLGEAAGSDTIAILLRPRTQCDIAASVQQLLSADRMAERLGGAAPGASALWRLRRALPPASPANAAADTKNSFCQMCGLKRVSDQPRTLRKQQSACSSRCLADWEPW